MNKKNYLTVSIFAIAIALVSAGLFGANSAHAITGIGANPLSGWVWSTNIGWISFNSADTGAGGANYNVYVDDRGDFGGYAWSPAIGWIKFGGLSDFPTDPNVTDDVVAMANAHVSTSTGEVTGWARACSGTADGVCGTMTSSATGWDGWLNMAGLNHVTGVPSGVSGVTYVPPSPPTGKGLFQGYSWGPIMGWHSFNVGSYSVFCANGCNGGGTNNPTTGGDIAADCAVTTSNGSNGAIIANFTVSNITGGSGTYSDFKWFPAGSGQLDTGATPSLSYTYPGTATQNYVATYIITDDTGAQSHILQCPSVSVTVAGTLTAPIALWFDPTTTHRVNPINDTTLAQNVGTPLQVPLGHTVKVDFKSTDNDYSCYGTETYNGGITSSNWTSSAKSLVQNNTGSYTFSGLSVGNYIVGLDCTAMSLPYNTNNPPSLFSLIDSIFGTHIVHAQTVIHSNSGLGDLQINVVKSSTHEI